MNRLGASARVRRITALAIVAFMLALALPATAFAATFVNQYPFGTIHGKPTAVGVVVFHTSPLRSGTQKITIDGVAQPTFVNLTSAGHWVATETGPDDNGAYKVTWAWVTDPARPNQGSMNCYPAAAAVTDGPHTVLATIKDTAGASYTDTWTYTVAIPPLVGAPTPAANSTVDTLTPTILVPVSDNSAGVSATATVNGSAAAVTITSGVARVTSPTLPNDATSTVTVTATDAAGNKTSKTWTFWVQAGGSLPFPVDECATCHPDAAADNDMGADCALCHAGQLDRPHTGTPAAYHTRADVSACSGCHVSDITAEHEGRQTSGGVDITCFTCHTSAVPAVVAAIASHDTACAGCHPGPSHPGADAKHAAASAKCTISGCHVGTLPALHASACAGCHKTAGIEACITCHPDQIDSNGDVISHGFDPAQHIGNDTVGPPAPRPNGCSDRDGIQSGCHDISNVALVHANVAGGPCAVCHGPGKTPSTNCRSCHPAGYGDASPGVLAGTMIYHHMNVAYLNDRSDAPAGAYYHWTPGVAYHLQPLPDGGWNDALAYQDCQEKCHKSYAGPGTPPFSGSKMWYSLSSADPYPLEQSPARTLTRSVTLPAEPTTLSFKAMWSLEYYDAVYDDETASEIYVPVGTDSAAVEVSTNGGGTWTPLAGDMGGGAGNPATGLSDGWRDATFDLSAYAGQTIKLRFLYAPAYVSSSYNANGWAVDDIEISGASGTVFQDGAETLDPGWTSTWVRAGGVFGF